MWHEARRSERKVHDLMDAARRRAQRRAVFLAKRRGDPRQSLQVVGSRCRMYRDDGLYQATEDQQGLIPWNGKQDIMIDRFDGRALLDFIRDTRHLRPQEKTEEEEELEEFVNFERYRDLIKHRHRGCRIFTLVSRFSIYGLTVSCLRPRNFRGSTVSDEEGLKHVSEELEAKFFAPFVSDRPHSAQPPTKKGSYSQVGFSYDDDGKGDSHLLESDEDDDDGGDGDDDEKDSSSDESNDEGINVIAKDFGIKRFSWLMYMDKKAKEEEKRQKEVIKGDPSIRKLSRKERRKMSQMEREREREAARITGSRLLHNDPYREPRRSPTYEAYSRSRRSKSRSRSPSYSRRSDRAAHADHGQRGRAKIAKVEYITEFGGSPIRSDQMLGVSPPPSPPPSLSDVQSRPSTSHILEALHVDPASGVTLDQERSTRPVVKTAVSTTSAIAKLSKSSTSMGGLKPVQNEKKETPQERLKRIMSKQLNKQIKKDSAAELAKKREQERQRQEKLAEMSRISRSRRRSYSRSRSHSPPRRYRRSRSRSWSRSRSRSPGRNSSRSRSPRRYHLRSRSPRARGRSRY